LPGLIPSPDTYGSPTLNPSAPQMIAMVSPAVPATECSVRLIGLPNASRLSDHGAGLLASVPVIVQISKLGRRCPCAEPEVTT